MDPTPFLEPRIAPRAIFDRLEERRARPRFFVPTPTGDWRAVTWGAFADEVRDTSAWLAAAAPVGPALSAGDRAAIYAPNRVEWISAAMAIQAVGGVVVPVYPASTADQAAYVIEHADARVVFVDTRVLLDRLLARWGALAGVRRIVLLDEALDAERVRAERAERGLPTPDATEVADKVVRFSRVLAFGSAANAEDPAAFARRMDAVSLDAPGLMLYTSGTSGNPKGVPLSHRNVACNGADWLRCCAAQLPEVETGTDLLWLPMSHVFGLGEACLGNTLGWTTYLCDPATVMTRLPEVRPDVFMSVPTIWEKLAHAALAEPDRARRGAALAKVTGGRLRFCLSGGAGLKREVKEALFAEGVLVLEGYGLTECSPTLTLNRPDAFRFDSVGQPLPSVELRLADDGEILARGPSVFGGYHKDPDATRNAFTDDGWFQTGDVGRFTEDGFLQIVDRKKDILVTAGGKNVPPANIEVRFADDPLIRHVVVYGDGRKYLVAGVWIDDASLDALLGARAKDAAARADAARTLVEARIARINEELASYETIKRFAILDQPLTVEGGLLTSTLKVRRKQVYAAFARELEALYGDGA